jgi:hypothetical protein
MNAYRRIAVPFALMAALVACAAMAANRSEQRPASGFTAITLAAPIHVELVQGDTESLTLEGDEDALAELETVVEDGVLKIRTRSRSEPRSLSKVRARISAKAILKLNIAGSGDINAVRLKSADLKLNVGGSGDIRIGSLAATSLDVTVAGSGDVEVGGKADSVSTSVAGSGDVKAGKLETLDATIKIAGSGDVAVWAKKSLTVKIVGSGDVRYYGDPEITKTVLGSGSLKRAGASPS